jgi:nicotinamidase-related amidase
MRYTLIVIDMQQSFLDGLYSSDRSDCVANVKREINKAVKNGSPILFVEFKDWGHTIKELIPQSYSNISFVTKNKRSGAEEIVQELNRQRWSDKIKVCGIFTNQCVKESVIDLIKIHKYKNIKIIEKACACGDSYYQTNAINEMKYLGASVY